MCLSALREAGKPVKCRYVVDRALAARRICGTWCTGRVLGGSWRGRDGVSRPITNLPACPSWICTECPSHGGVQSIRVGVMTAYPAEGALSIPFIFC